jgi:hypothetical protein
MAHPSEQLQCSSEIEAPFSGLQFFVAVLHPEDKYLFVIQMQIPMMRTGIESCNRVKRLGRGGTRTSRICKSNLWMARKKLIAMMGVVRAQAA